MQATRSSADGKADTRVGRQSLTSLGVAMPDGTRHVFEQRFHDDIVIDAW